MHSLALAQIVSVVGLSFGGSILPATVDFETLSTGTTYGVPTHSAGEFAFSQNNIDVFVHSLSVNSMPQFFQAEVGGENATGFSSNALSLDNISTQFDFGNLSFEVTQASVEYQEFGGLNNFAVNGGSPIELLSLSSLPANIAPGITALVDDGVIMLTAADGFGISNFIIGGQELGIDNITAIPEPSLLVLVTVGWLLAVRRSCGRRAAS